MIYLLNCTKSCFLKIVIFILILFLFFGCSLETDDDYLIGINLELTGDLAQYGNNCYNGIKLAAEEINKQGGISGKQVKIMVLDNCSQSSLSSLNHIKFSQKENCLAIIGPATSSLVKASLESGTKTMLITPGGTADKLTENSNGKNFIVRTCYTDSFQGKYLAEYAKKLNLNKFVALIDKSSDYSCSLAEVFENNLKFLGGEIIEKKYYTSLDTDFMAVLSSFHFENADGIFIPGYYTQAGLIIKQLRLKGITKPILSGDAFDSPALLDIVGEKSFLNNIFFTNHFVSNSENKFSIRYKDKYKKNPAAYGALGYDSLNIILNSLKRLNEKNENIDKLSLKNEVLKTTDFEGVTGKISMNNQGNAEKQPILVTFKDGKQEAVFDNN